MSSRATSPTENTINSTSFRSLNAEQRLQALAAKSDLSGKVILLFGTGGSADFSTDPITTSTATRLSAHGAQLILVQVGGGGGDNRSKEGGLQKLAATVDAAALHGNRWHCGPDGKWTRVQKAAVYHLEEDFGGSVEALVKTVVVDQGLGRLDGLVFMPSSTSSSASSASSSALSSPSLMAQLEARISAELLTLVRFVQATVGHLEEQGGAIVTVSTTVALKPVSFVWCFCLNFFFTFLFIFVLI